MVLDRGPEKSGQLVSYLHARPGNGAYKDVQATGRGSQDSGLLSAIAQPQLGSYRQKPTPSLAHEKQRSRVPRLQECMPAAGKALRAP